MTLSKRAKVRFKLASVTEKKKVGAAAKTLYEFELLGPKRAQEIARWASKRRGGC